MSKSGRTRCPECGAEIDNRPLKKRVIIAEGGADARFLSALLKRHKLSRLFQVWRHAHGKGGFTERLKALRAHADFRVVDLVVLERDADQVDPNKALKNMQKQIRKEANDDL